MGAPSDIKWGGTVGDYGKIGIYPKLSSTNTTTTVTVEIWFASRYSVSDTNNTLYYDALKTSGGSASSSKGSLSIKTTVASGPEWPSSNQVKLKTFTHTYDRKKDAYTIYLHAKLSNVDRVGGTMVDNKSISIPALATYQVSYNANGGSGAPSAQTKTYGVTLKLSTTKPTRTGYSFQGWATSSGGSVAYAAGANYTANAAVTLYAVWKANTYKVTYNANGGTGAPASQTKTYDVTLKLSTTVPTRANYTFKGWATSSGGSVAYASGVNYTRDEDVTLYAVWELAYVKPRLTNVSVSRCDSAGTPTDDGTYALIKFNWACDKTVDAIEIKSVQANIDIGLYATGTSGSVSQIIGGGKLDINHTYDITITVNDTTGYNYAKRTLPSATFPIDILAEAKGIAFGKAAEKTDTADFKYATYHRGPATFENCKAIYGTRTDGTVVEAFNPINENGRVVLGWDNYNKKLAETRVYGFDVEIGVSNVGGSITPWRPYRRKGDSTELTIRTAGFITNSKTDVYFTIPISVPIIGEPTITVSTLNGFILRQDGQYTHGSADDVYAKPTKYEVSYGKYYGGIFVKATFSNVTNAINNAPIGIQWNGKITFS